MKLNIIHSDDFCTHARSDYGWSVFVLTDKHTGKRETIPAARLFGAYTLASDDGELMPAMGAGAVVAAVTSIAADSVFAGMAAGFGSAMAFGNVQKTLILVFDDQRSLAIRCTKKQANKLMAKAKVVAEI